MYKYIVLNDFEFYDCKKHIDVCFKKDDVLKIRDYSYICPYTKHTIACKEINGENYMTIADYRNLKKSRFFRDFLISKGNSSYRAKIKYISELEGYIILVEIKENCWCRCGDYKSAVIWDTIEDAESYIELSSNLELFEEK